MLFAMTALSVYMWQVSGFIVTAILCTILTGFQFFRLLNYVERTNRELERFFLSIEYDDFSQSFHMPKLGGSFSQLGKAFEDVMERFRATRQSKEETAQFSQVMMQQVPIAVVVFAIGGKVEFLNRKARALFGSAAFMDLGVLTQQVPDLGRYLESAESGSRKLIEATINRVGYQLMVSVTHFSSRAGAKKIVTLQNIRSELDRQEVQAWQDLIRVLSHEIMNSITPITSLSHSAGGMLRSLADGKAEPDPELLEDMASAVETIARRSDGLLGFVERYRQVARLPNPSLAEVNLAVLLDEIAHLMRHEMAERRVALGLSLEELPTTFVDEQMLSQAVINLLRNAMDAVTSVNQPTVYLKGYVALDGQVSISVEDNGCGIPEVDLHRIWIPFFTTKAYGSGVGLSLVRQITLAHNGTVFVKSRPGYGTTVTMQLPINLL